MYAKLILQNPQNPSLLIRDIVRLCTSTTPNVSVISGFANTSSIVDSTPAGWSFVYSNVDGVTLGNVSSPTSTGSQDWWGISAPTQGGGTKYAKLTCCWSGNSSVSSSYYLSTAYAIFSGNGTVLNEGYRVVPTTSSTDTTFSAGTYYCSDIRGTGTFHLIATPSHITIVKEASSVGGVWETAQTDAHTYYGIPPVIQYNINGSTNQTTSISSGGSSGPTTVGPNAQAPVVSACLVNFTNAATGVYQSTLQLGFSGNMGSQPYLYGTTNKTTTVSTTGQTRSIATPIFFQAHNYGLPTTFVSGISNIYSTKNTGSTGDTMIINGTTYTYFNAGTNQLSQGFLFNTAA